MFRKYLPLELIIIGLLNVLLFSGVSKISPQSNTTIKLFITGALIHLLFEYSPFGNANKLWCEATFPAPKA